jgi:hypothetical protein
VSLGKTLIEMKIDKPGGGWILFFRVRCLLAREGPAGNKSGGTRANLHGDLAALIPSGADLTQPGFAPTPGLDGRTGRLLAGVSHSYPQGGHFLEAWGQREDRSHSTVWPNPHSDPHSWSDLNGWQNRWNKLILMVPEVGLEPTRRPDPRGILRPPQRKIYPICEWATVAVWPGMTRVAANSPRWWMCGHVCRCLGVMVTKR